MKGGWGGTVERVTEEGPLVVAVVVVGTRRLAKDVGLLPPAALKSSSEVCLVRS